MRKRHRRGNNIWQVSKQGQLKTIPMMPKEAFLRNKKSQILKKMFQLLVEVANDPLLTNEGLVVASLLVGGAFDVVSTFGTNLKQ